MEALSALTEGTAGHIIRRPNAIRPARAADIIRAEAFFIFFI